MSSSVASLLTGLDDVLGRVERMEQGLPGAVPHASQTSNTSADETDVSDPRRGVRSKKTFKMKKVWGASELGRFFVTGLTDASAKPSHFYCRLCRKDVSILTHGMHEILRHYQGTKHFPRDQRLRLETPGWRVLDFEGNVMPDEDADLVGNVLSLDNDAESRACHGSIPTHLSCKVGNKNDWV